MIDAAFVVSAPEEIGLDSERLARLYEYVAGQVDAGLPSAQIAIGRHGRVAGVRTFGAATRGGVTSPADAETLYCWYSTAKGVSAVGVWALIEDGLLRLDERAADVVPEFAGNGKDVITVEQVLTFTAGFPLAPMHPRLWEDRAARLERIKSWRLNSVPGAQYEYHASSAHWLLMEMITYRTGLDFRDYVRSRLFEPMGVPDLHLGIPDELQALIADVSYVDSAVQSDPGLGTEINPDTILHFNLASKRRSGCPAAAVFAGAGEIALFYQRLVSPVESAEYAALKPETIRYATSVRTQEWQHAGALPVNRALGVVVAGDHPVERGFGAHASPRAFGHAGYGGQIAWGDPDTGLSVGFCTNGFDSSERVRERSRTISTLAAECLIGAKSD